MKIRIDIDCTPDEARAFFGLPDVKPMQRAVMADLEERIKLALASMSPEAMIKTWLPASIEGFEQMQKMFWSNIGASSKKG